MAIIYFSYLFDDLRFQEVMSPLIPELEAGDYQSLYSLAKETLNSRPKLWDILYDLNLGYSFAEETEGALDPNSLLMKVLVQFLERIVIPEPNAWRMLGPALPVIGWSKDETKLLLSGRSLCTLLVPHRNYPPTSYYDLSGYKMQTRPWCEGYIGWLDYKTVDQLCHQLEKGRVTFFEFAKQPAEILQKEFSYVEDFSLEWLSKSLTEAYEYKMQELDIARRAKKAIAMTIA